jgi:hypothetical protein
VVQCPGSRAAAAAMGVHAALQQLVAGAIAMQAAAMARRYSGAASCCKPRRWHIGEDGPRVPAAVLTYPDLQSRWSCRDVQAWLMQVPSGS